VHEFYEVRQLRIQARSWPRVIAQVQETLRPAAESEGGTLYGLFLPQIGLAANHGVLIRAWRERAALDRAAASPLEGIDDLVESEAERWVATVRPEQPSPPREGGVFAHRRFEIAESDWPEFLDLSQQAWVGFEKDFDAQVQGFFRSLDVQSPDARVLLLTRYGSLADWQTSRMAGERTPEQEAVRARFQRRHTLTRATIVVTTVLSGPS
jgi:hypothetical protein